MERTKMPRIKRAAQFAPFDALKGLHDALERKRQEHIKNQKGISVESDATNNNVETKFVKVNKDNKSN